MGPTVFAVAIVDVGKAVAQEFGFNHSLCRRTTESTGPTPNVTARIAESAEPVGVRGREPLPDLGIWVEFYDGLGGGLETRLQVSLGPVAGSVVFNPLVMLADGEIIQFWDDGRAVADDDGFLFEVSIDLFDQSYGQFLIVVYVDDECYDFGHPLTRTRGIRCLFM